VPFTNLATEVSTFLHVVRIAMSAHKYLSVFFQLLEDYLSSAAAQHHPLVVLLKTGGLNN